MQSEGNRGCARLLQADRRVAAGGDNRVVRSWEDDKGDNGRCGNAWCRSQIAQQTIAIAMRGLKCRIRGVIMRRIIGHKMRHMRKPIGLHVVLRRVDNATQQRQQHDKR